MILHYWRTTLQITIFLCLGILVAEYIRSSRKEEKKEEERVAELSQIQNDLRDLYMETAKQDAQIRELVRILRLKMPEVSYTPRPYDERQIPEHHRDDYHEEEEKSMFSYVKGWVWSAIDLIIPEDGSDAESSPQKNSSQTGNTTSTVLQVVPSPPIPGNPSQNNPSIPPPVKKS